MFSAIFGVMVLLYAIQNVANITGGMYASFQYVLGQSDHVAYPASVVPPLTHPVWIWMALTLVLVLEFACGAFVLLGAWKMWMARAGTNEEYRAAKRYALNGFGIGVVVWFLLFGALGGAAFQMWQTEIGASSFNGAFQLVVYSLLLFGLVSMDE